MKKVIPFLLLVLFFIAAAWYSLLREPDPVHETPPPTLVLKPAVEEAPADPWPSDPVQEDIAEPPPPPLPPLDESDEPIKQELAVIAGSEPLVQYLVKDQVISRLVATIDALDGRQVPPLVNPIRSPEGKFVVGTEGDRYLVNEDNATRYDAYVELLQQMNTTMLASVYRHYYPLFQQAWEDNGGEGLFNDRLLGIIDHLAQAPDVKGVIYLLKPEAVYLYEDPALEALTAGQKILLRMGPDNAAAVKAKLGEIQDLLLADNAPIKFNFQPEEGQ
jgi:hypothetical protein